MPEKERPQDFSLNGEKSLELELLAEIEEKRKMYEAYDLVPKDHLTDDEMAHWRLLKKDLEDLRLKLAKLQNKPN